MRRFLAAVLCILLLSTTVFADNALSSVNTNATVNATGSCQVTLTVTIRLDQPVTGLVFPLGTDITAVSLNGSSANLSKEGGITCVKLSHLDGQTGSFPLTFQYTVNSVVSEDDSGKQIITVPVLYGFRYPVEQMSFTVTLPGEFDAIPSFYSGYHEEDIERSIHYSVIGTAITATVVDTLKDSETLFLKLEAPEGMFPRAQAVGGSLPFDNIAIGVCIALALVYWLTSMACLPSFPIRRSTPPDGLSAGTVGSYLVHKRADLTLMVVNWAQLGYLIIHLDEHGRVLLHKKMEMGNERSSFEQRTFKTLFGKGSLTDATGYRYARLWENTAALSRRYASGFRSDSGNPKLFRILACGVGLFTGVAMGDSISSAPTWRIVWMILMGSLGTAASWQIQEGMSCLHLKDKSPLLYGAVCCGAVLLTGQLSGCLGYAGLCVGWNLLVGLMAAYGGRRSENGQRIFIDILGLRRYMKKVSKGELTRILRSNPDYYYELAPYALALGVDRAFARRFGNLHQPTCTWLAADTGSPRTAGEWYPLLREAVDAMDRQHRRTFLERVLNLG